MVEKQDMTGGREAAHPSQLFSCLPSLPELHHAQRLPAMFEDSTHQLWRCDTTDGAMMLKVCQQPMLETSGCWQVIDNLFDLYLPRHLANINHIQDTLEQQGLIPLPELINWSGESEIFPAYILTRFVDGVMLERSHLKDNTIAQFAAHIASLHQVEYPMWGDLCQPQREAKAWSTAVRQTLLNQGEKDLISPNWMDVVLSELELIEHTTFAPIMLDNRWDQYLFEDNRIKALVDIDAFVAGPRELELVLLEYQLDSRQAALFSEVYSESIPMPDLSEVRLSYRLLLFLMNALGESDLEKWMLAPERF